MVNVAEETKNPETVMPVAIILTLAVTTALYILISLLAVGAVSPAELSNSDAPLTLLFERVSGLPGGTITVIAIFSVLNGALIQIIMASRVLFGLTRRGWLPGPLAHVNRTTRTPVNAIVLCALVVVALTLAFDLERLALATSFITLLIFALVNAALIAVKRKSVADAHTGFRAPGWVPVCGLLSIAGLLIFRAVDTLS